MIYLCSDIPSPLSLTEVPNSLLLSSEAHHISPEAPSKAHEGPTEQNDQ